MRALEEDVQTQLRARRLSWGIGATLGAAVIFAPAASADTFTVNTLDDGDDGSCADADCSLREAADEANTAADADTITFATGLSGTIELTDTDGDIPILAATTITGPRRRTFTVSGENNYRIFYIKPDDVGEAYDDVSISGLTLTNGYESSSGGALYSYEATLTLSAVALTGNHANDGGAVFAEDNPMTIVDSSFTNNEADDNGGALYSNNTGSGPTGDFVIRNTTFVNNRAVENGGAVDLSGSDVDGDVIVENSTFSGNVSSDGVGGGIYVDETDEDGQIVIRNSTFSNNIAFYGGGAYLGDGEGGILIENSTFSANTAQYDGGGIYFDGLYEDESNLIRNSTITGNTAGLNPGDYSGPYGGGGVYLQGLVRRSRSRRRGTGRDLIVDRRKQHGGVDFGPDLGEGEFADGFNVDFSPDRESGRRRHQPGRHRQPRRCRPAARPARRTTAGATQTHLPLAGQPGARRGSQQRPRHRPARRRRGRSTPATGERCRQRRDRHRLRSSAVPTAACKGKPASVLFDPGSPILGGDANDVVVGTGASETINTGKGKDTVCAAGGNDKAKTGGGKDKAFGAGGKDKLSGQGGKDLLSGQAGKDTLKGGGDADRLKGGGGKDSERQ